MNTPDLTTPDQTTPALPDLRPQLLAAQTWVAELIENVQPEQLTDPTPCDEFDVGTLLEHLWAVQNRIAVVGDTGSFEGTPFSIALPESDLGADFRTQVERSRLAWAGDDARLTSTCTLPWGPIPGAAALAAWIGEHVVHGWDVAVATGQPSEADPVLVRISRLSLEQVLPPEIRGDARVPFGPVVPPADTAGPTEQLANFVGRPSRPRWIQ